LAQDQRNDPVGHYIPDTSAAATNMREQIGEQYKRLRPADVQRIHDAALGDNNRLRFPCAPIGDGRW